MAVASPFTITCPPVSSRISSVSTWVTRELPVMKGAGPDAGEVPGPGRRRRPPGPAPPATGRRRAPGGAPEYPRLGPRPAGWPPFPGGRWPGRGRSLRPEGFRGTRRPPAASGRPGLAASVVMSPQFSRPPEEHPAVRTMMSLAISSFSQLHGQHVVPACRQVGASPPHRRFP